MYYYTGWELYISNNHSAMFILIFKNFLGEPLFITPYLKKGQWKIAQQLAKVDNKVFIPGTWDTQIENIESYSGYFTVNTPECDSNLFFWYFPSEVIIISTLFMPFLNPSLSIF